MTKKPFLALFGTLALGSSCIIVDGKPYGIGSWDDAVHGSGVRADETRLVDAFHSIELSVPARASVEVGGAPGLKLSGDDDLLAHVTTRIRDGVLEIDMKGRYRFRERLEIEISTPELQSFAIEGSGDVRIEGVDTDRFAASIDGSGDMSITGRARALNASIAGSGDMRLGELAAEEARLSIEGSGDMVVRVSESLHYSIEGSGDIRYHGAPGVSGGISGSGSVRGR